MSTIQTNINKFEQKLKKEKLSADTVKNYLSDTNHLKVWAADNNIKSLTKQNILKYISYLKMNNVSDSSINRKLATLRRLAKFLNDDFMSDIKNAGITNKFTQQIDTNNENKQNLTTSYVALFILMIAFIAISNYASSKQSGIPVNTSNTPIIISDKIVVDRADLAHLPSDPIVSNDTPVIQIPQNDQELYFRLATSQNDNTYYYLNEDNINTNNINSAISGGVILHAGNTETAVYHPRITVDSKIVLTPQGSTGNNVLYINLVNDGIFMINSDEPLMSDVRVNWIAY